MESMPRRKKVPTVQPLLLTIPDVAIQLGVCRTTVYNLIYHKGLPSIVLRGVRRVHPVSLQEWLKECEQQSA
jgi:excisionase family DNA binding protein